MRILQDIDETLERRDGISPLWTCITQGASLNDGFDKIDDV
jgi:hypothetical protein